jgi:hypothetical protein
MSLNSGSLNDEKFRNSMAQSIEQEFISAWTAVYGRPLPERGEKERRIIFLAISRGILKYLDENADSIQVTRHSFHDYDVDLDVVIPDHR